MTTNYNKKDKRGINLSQGGAKKRKRLYKKLIAGITKKSNV